MKNCKVRLTSADEDIKKCIFFEPNNPKFEAEKDNSMVGHAIVKEESTTTFIDEQEGIGHPYILGKRQK
jgi:hypothetical protein